MTSDKFKFGRVRVADIIVEERQRKDLGDLRGLSDSIGDLGLLQLPLITSWIVNGQHKLVFGGRRLAAAIARRDEFIDVRITDETDPIKLKVMEWAENAHRQDYTWQEKCSAVVEIHRDCVARHGPSWTRKQTAKLLPASETLVSEYLAIDELARKGHTELKEAGDFGTARTMMRRINDRAADAETEEMDELLSPLTGGYKVTEKSEIPIINANFCEWAPAYTGPKFNFLHCDFPYGIDTDKRQQGNAPTVHGRYDDSSPVYWRLLDALCTNLNRICADSAHIMFWFSMHNYCDTLKFFADNSDFKINPFPLVWMKSDGKGMLPDRMHEPRRIYETCLFGSRGGRVTAASVANAYLAPTDTSDHLSPKPEDMLRHFFRMFVDKNSKVLDPTCGSGSALRAAKSLGAADVLGIEKDKDFAERATRSFKNWLVANGNGQAPAPTAQDSTTNL